MCHTPWMEWDRGLPLKSVLKWSSQQQQVVHMTPYTGDVRGVRIREATLHVWFFSFFCREMNSGTAFCIEMRDRSTILYQVRGGCGLLIWRISRTRKNEEVVCVMWILGCSVWKGWSWLCVSCRSSLVWHTCWHQCQWCLVVHVLACDCAYRAKEYAKNYRNECLFVSSPLWLNSGVLSLLGFWVI
jgi:hypothetical protein